MYQHITVNAGQLIKALGVILRAELQAMIWGSYGTGKTSIVRQVGEALKFESVICILPSQDDVIDYKLPYLLDMDGEKISAFALSERLPRSGRHLIFVDEINTAPMSLQPTLYGLILEGVIGNYRTPKGCCRLAAGNRETDKCAANPMSAALKDRLTVHLNLVPDSDSWCLWAAKHGIRPEVMAFVRDHPQALEEANPDDPCGGCTPRSLAGLSKILDQGIPTEIEQQMIQGCIGQGTGTKFSAYLEIFRNKIKIDEILKNPEKAKVPDRADICFGIATALAYKATPENFKGILTYASRMAETYSVVVVMDALRRNPKLKETKAYTEFAVKNHDLVI